MRMGSGKVRQCVISTMGQLSTMIASAAFCWFEPITIRLQEDSELNITSDDVSWVLAIVELGTIIGSLLSGYLANRFGRKYIIMSVAPLCLAGWILVLCSKTMLSLIVVQILHGLAVGVVFTVMPIYTAEIAEPKIRGCLSGFFQAAWYLGIVYPFSIGPHLNYNIFAYACLPFPIIFAIVWLFAPETPYYLLMTKREDEAKKVLKYFRDEDVEEEFRDMQTAVLKEMSTEGSWKILFCDKVERKSFIIVLIVGIAKYLTGLTALLNYALDIFSRSVSFLPAEDMTILLALLLTLIAIVGAFMSDRIGRRPLLLLSCFGCFVGTLIVGGYFYIHEKTNIDASNFIWALYIGLAMYCIFSGIGVGPLLQTLQSEMFGASTRGIAGGIIEGFVAFLSLVVIKIYTPINEAYGVYLTYWFYSLVGLVCFILLSLLVYETAGKTIGQMEDTPRNRALA